MIIGFRTKSLLKDFLYQILQYENEKTKAQKNSESSGLPLTLPSELELETEPPNLLVRGRAPEAWGLRKQSLAGFAFGQGTKKTEKEK